MEIGVPKEIKRDERRVALRPDQAQMLIKAGHKVWVEGNAGRAIGYTDADYARVGASIATQAEVYEHATLLLKVKCPVQEEYGFLSDRHILFAYLHFDENILPADINQIVTSGIAAIAYEWVGNGYQFPLLKPMSELTGAIFARKAMSLLMEHKGVLGGAYLPNWPACAAMVIGAGHIGANAINVFLRNECRLLVVDKHPETLNKRLRPYVDLDQWTNGNIEVIGFDESKPRASAAALRKRLPQMDIVICAAVRRPTLPKERCEYLITHEDVMTMSRNSVLCDATACDKDFIETAVSSDSLTETYIEGGVVHYNCDHIPSLVARTATTLLTDAIFPYVKQLADRGFECAVSDNFTLANGVMCYKKHLTHEYSARKKELEYTALSNVL
jgi:alanine dehydrogenase